MTPIASVLVHSSVHVNTLCERLDSLFMAVSPTFLAAWPRTIRLATSFTAAQERPLILLHHLAGGTTLSTQAKNYGQHIKE